MGCGASKPAPFDWANEEGEKPKPVPLHRTKSGTPSEEPLQVEERAAPAEAAGEQPEEKLPRDKKLIRTNTGLIGPAVLD